MYPSTNKFIVNCTRKGKRSSTYIIDFQYNQQLIDRIKTLPVKERKWSSLNKNWDVKVAGLLRIMSYYRKSDKIFFDFGGIEPKKVFVEQIKKIQDKEREDLEKLEKLKLKNKEAIELKIDLEKNYEKHSKLLHSFLKKGVKLYPHQIVGTVFLNYVKSALISLEMGLGKTLIAIAYAEMMGFHKVFVITPNSLKYNFYNEVVKFTHSPAHIIGSKKNKYTIEESKYVIVNYDYFRTKDAKKVNAKFKKLDLGIIDAVVCDESHKLKNTNANTYKNFKRIFKEIEYKVFLSGTPAPNRVHELYTVLNQISPIEFSTKKFFYEYYCGMFYNPNTDFGDGWMREPNTARLEELFHKITPYTYRKRKEEVLTDLPDKIYQKIMLDLDRIQDLQYEEIERGVANEIFSAEKLSGANALTIMLRLRQYTSMIKLDYIKELIDQLLNENQKIVVVDMFKDVLKQLQPMYPEISALHTGDVSVDERAEIVADFQNPNGKCKLFLASIQTANYGLTLTEASHMFIITLPFSVGEYDQVADRLHRIGAKDTVFIYPLVFKGTIDEYVFSVIEDKRAEIMKGIDNIDYKSEVSESVLKDVINKLRQKYGN